VLTYFFDSRIKAHGALIGWEDGVDKQAVDEIKQHFGVVAEGLESKIEIIAEGHALLRAEIKNSIDRGGRGCDSLAIRAERNQR